jgi:hypothetical protein
MLHTFAELQDRARKCRDRASQALDPEARAEMLELAKTFEEEAATVEQAGTYDENYQDGWSSVAGCEPLPEHPTQPLAGEERTPEKGYMYGSNDAKDAGKS